MISQLLTQQEIINILIEQNIPSTYVCGDGTLCGMLAKRVVPAMVGAQSMRHGQPKRFWWIYRDNENNKFILKCSYFDVDDTPLTYEQFYEKLTILYDQQTLAKIPAIAYTSDATIEWISTGMGEWTATYNVPTPTSGCMIAGALSKILLKPIQYVCGGTITDGIAGFVYGQYSDSNGGYYYTKLSESPQPPCCSELQLENCGGTYPETGICVQLECCVDNISVC